MYQLTDEIIIKLLGREMYDYCIQKSKEVCNNSAFYDVMLCAAIGKLLEKDAVKVTANVPTT